MIEIKNITKSFPGVLALDNVCLSIRKNEVHAIVGENGAGKSTLMKILGGVHPADSGKIYIDGKQVNIKNIDESHQVGISVIFQEFNLMPELTVAENLFITDLPYVKGIGAVKYKRLNDKAQLLLEELDVDISPKAYIKDLTVSERQMVEIGKALSNNSDIIIMDEPTATLNNQEVEKLYSIIRKLKAQGKTILYISHRLKEIFDITDRLSVLRDGKYIGTQETSNMTNDDIVRMMIGRDISNYYSTSATNKIGDTLLEVKGISKKDIFEDISFSLKKGEILGMAGLMGSGREEILEAIYGLIMIDSGEIDLEGTPLNMKSPKHTMNQGVAFLTNDRKNAGIFEQMSVKENLSINILSKLCKFVFHLDEKKEKELLSKYTKFMNIKYADESQQIMFLSGGNQQKVLLSRAIAAECKVLLLLEPTRGIDVGAKAEIYELLHQLAKSGVAIVVVSSELSEIISVCDRTLVVWQGEITGELEKSEMTEEAIMMLATGSVKKAMGA
jgi:ABC-type sugar transport system ATPase subunit